MKAQDAINDHVSERAMDTYMFKHVIYNDSTLDELANQVFELMHNVYKM